MYEIFICPRCTAICVIVVGVFVFSSHKKTSHPVSLPRLGKLSPVEVTDMPLYGATATRTLANNQTDISPKVAGYVTKIAFTPGGTFVKTGSVLIQLDNRKQQDDVAAAQADLELSQLQFQRDLKALRFNSASHAL